MSSIGDWSNVPLNVRKQIQQGNVASMEALFGSNPGVGQLIEFSLAWFHDDGGSGIDVDWYLDPEPESKGGTQPAIKPSKYNRSLQETTCQEYKQRLLVEGQPQSVAGAVLSVHLHG